MKRYLSLLLALVLVLSVFVMAPAVADDTVTLKVVKGSNIQSFFEGEDENHNYMVDWIKESLGINLDWYILPSENGQAKLNAMMAAANEVPDVIWSLGNRAQWLDYVNQGLVIALDDYIPDREEFFKYDSVGAWKLGVLDGELYAVSVVGNQSDTDWIWWYSKAALADAGIEFPAKDEITLDEFTDILYKLHEAYPDKIVLGSAGGLNQFAQLAAAFGIANDYRVAEDGTLEYSWATEDAKEYLEYLNKLYTDGIIDPEFLVTDKEQLNAKLMNGEVLTAMFAWYDYTGTYKNNLGDKVEYGETDHEFHWEYVSVIDGGKATKHQTNGKVNQFYECVSYACQHPQEAVDLCYFSTTPEYYDKCFFGDEGVDYYYDENGVRWRNQDTQIGKLFGESGTQWYVYYYMAESKEQRIDRLATGNPTYDMEHIMDSFYAAKGVDNPIAEMPMIEAYQDSQTDVDDVKESYLIKFMMGDKSFDEWDAYLSELEAVGLSDVVDALNEWYATL